MRLLFIGNSHTYYNSLPELLRLLAEANGESVDYQTSFGGSYTLRDHWQGEGARLVEAGPWDAIILQPSGTEPLIHEARQTLEYAGRFAERIHQQEARCLWFMTQAYGAHSPSVRARVASMPPEAAERLEQMDEAIEALFHEIQSAHGGEIVPVGRAWRHLQQQSAAPQLYAPDGYHPAPLGSLLGAMVHYDVIFGQLPEKHPSGMSVPSELDGFSGGRIRLNPKTGEWRSLSEATAVAIE